MAPTEAAPSDSPAHERPAAALPPVEAPTGTFILQLFLIPLIIVSVVVMLWLLFGWLAHMGGDSPQELIAGLKRGDETSWHSAYKLADLLRNPNPKYDALRRDPALAKRLADLLNAELNQPAKGTGDKARVMHRMYLCRALGAFDIPTGLPVLMRAAKEERDPVEVPVRLSALEGISSLADNCGPKEFQENRELMTLLIECSREPDDSGPPVTTKEGDPTTYRPHAEIRAVAAYTLGVIGGDEALARLKLQLNDAYSNARYNAATGLARHGDPACVRVLKEMLDPENERAAQDESYADDKDRKRATVLLNGIRAAVIFVEANPGANSTELKQSLERLTKADLASLKTDRGKIQSGAAEALRLIEKAQARNTGG